jgi:Extensin-like protein C-terminus
MPLQGRLRAASIQSWKPQATESVLADSVRITVLDSWLKPVVASRAPADSSSSGTVEGNAASKPELADKTASSVTATKTSAITAAKAEPAAAPSPPPAAAELTTDPKAQFVMFLHEDACRRFGTVLGPEANAAHKNHFHLDMKTRRKSFCE